MPALSPTMTEGNIASWRVNEGDSFSAGDVLLEIETDKATMDVEAQEDGIMMKIMAQSGSKAVQVGVRIAVVAEADDDISTLEIPADKQSKQPSQDSSQQETTSASEQGESKSADKGSRGPRAESGETHEQNHPLLPSVEHLVKEEGLSKEDISKIKPTGPNGRLLKGDVLAYLGAIKPETPGNLASHFAKLAHLDLSNIKVAPQKEAPAAKAPADEELDGPLIEAVEVQIPISLAKAVEVQKRIKDTLDVFLPLSTFISRAAEVANDGLPLPDRAPTADELFDQVLGLDKVKAAKGSRGIYLPQISTIPPASMLAPRQPTARQSDIIDILAAPKKQPSPEYMIPTTPGMSSGDNVFTLIVPKEEEERAQVFLERCKVILEKEPGRLVL